MTKNKNNQAIWNSRIKKSASTLFQKVGNKGRLTQPYFEKDGLLVLFKRDRCV